MSRDPRQPLDYVDEPPVAAPTRVMWIGSVLVGSLLVLGVALFASMIGALS